MAVFAWASSKEMHLISRMRKGRSRDKRPFTKAGASERRGQESKCSIYVQSQVSLTQSRIIRKKVSSSGTFHITCDTFSCSNVLSPERMIAAEIRGH
jgi:hypothetical protein